MRALLWRVSAVLYPAFCSVTASGPIRRPAAARSSALAAPPCGLRFPSKSCSESTPKRFLRTLRKCRASALGAEPTRLASPGVIRAGSGNSTNGDTVMYQNKAILIGFLGKDAEVRNANNRSFTTFSLATKSSYKDKKKGEYVSHTEWHRCVVFGKLAEFAATLSKGAHVQVEGEIRTREYDSKIFFKQKTAYEIRVDSILKLDRAETAAPEDQEHDDQSGEESAA